MATTSSPTVAAGASAERVSSSYKSLYARNLVAHQRLTRRFQILRAEHASLRLQLDTFLRDHQATISDQRGAAVAMQQLRDRLAQVSGSARLDRQRHARLQYKHAL